MYISVFNICFSGVAHHIVNLFINILDVHQQDNSQDMHKVYLLN